MRQGDGRGTGGCRPRARLVDDAYENGRLVRWGPVSTGRKETATPAGAFNLTWRARRRRRTDNQDWLPEWYFNFVNARGVSFHLFDLPGYPASHACVRLLLRDAQWLYGWGEQWTLDDSRRHVLTPGTSSARPIYSANFNSSRASSSARTRFRFSPLLVVGTYPFGTPAGWLSLDALSTPLVLRSGEVFGPPLPPLKKLLLFAGVF